MQRLTNHAGLREGVWTKLGDEGMSAHDCDNVTLHGMGARDRDGVSILLELSSFMPRKGGTDAKQPGSARVWSPHQLMPLFRRIQSSLALQNCFVVFSAVTSFFIDEAKFVREADHVPMKTRPAHGITEVARTSCHLSHHVTHCWLLKFGCASR